MTLSVIIKGGTVYDGAGGPGVRADVGIRGDRIVLVGTALPESPDAEVLDASGLAVTPGFINVLSHGWASLQLDGSGASDVLQGVTTEIFGEGLSLGPANREIEQLMRRFEPAAGARFDFPRLGQGLDALEAAGVTPNVASFVGGHNLRMLAADFDDRPLAASETDLIRGLLAEELQDGALGLATALIYPPGGFADTDELAGLCEVVGRHGGTYISHLRSEGDRFLECLDELIELGRRGACQAEVYHLKAIGRENWPKMQAAVDRISAARSAGQPVSANMYPYTAGGTALASCIPPRFHVGGPEAFRERLERHADRAAMAAAVREATDVENLYLGSTADGILFPSDLSDGTATAGKRLSQVTRELGMDDDVDCLLELLRRDADVDAIYFMMDEANVELGLAQPWVSIGSDGAAHPALPPFTDAGAHPRTYGAFARVLARYVRERGVLTFPEAVRRMSSLPATRLGLSDRGALAEGHYADVVVLDPDTVADTSTYTSPHSHAVGVTHVLVNGVLAVRDGAMTSERPGRRLRLRG